jgi:replicative DNA helicase
MTPDDETPGRTPPHDVAAEEAVLGGMLVSSEAVADVRDVVAGRDFYRPAHELVFDAILRLHAAGHPHDPVAVAAALTATGDITRVGGAARIHDLHATVASPRSAGYHAGIVAGCSFRRRLIAAGGAVQQLGWSTDGGDIASIGAAAQAEVAAVAEGTPSGSVPWLSDVADAAMDAIGQVRSTPTPWHDLNEKILGWEPGCVHVIGARPATGKTLVGIQAAVDMATEYRRGVLYASLEMKAARLYQRALALLSSVDHHHIKTGQLSESEWRALSKADGILRDCPLAIYDDRRVTVAGLAARARAVNRQQRLGLVIVDYLQLLHAAPSANRSRNREQEVAQISGALHELAGELDVPVVVLAQLNRNPAGRSDKRPLLSDLRESGSVEQDADAVILLHRDEEEEPDVLHMLVAKNRDGATGPLKLTWEARHSRVVDHQWRPSDIADRIGAA